MFLQDAPCLTVQNASLEKKTFTGVDEFPFKPPIFWDTQTMGGQNQCVRPIETQLETFIFVLYYLNRTLSFHFNSASIERFCNEVFVV